MRAAFPNISTNEVVTRAKAFRQFELCVCMARDVSSLRDIDAVLGDAGAALDAVRTGDRDHDRCYRCHNR